MQEKLFRIWLFMMCIVMFTACTDGEESHDVCSRMAEISFGGVVQKIIVTRASTDEETTTDLISSENDYGDIYIHTHVDDKTVPDNFRTNGVYVTRKNGTAGRLEPQSDSQKLEWYTTTSPHYFQAWNVPDGVTMDDAGTSLIAGKVSFAPKDEDHAPNTDINKANNIALEKFIGAKEGAVDYRTSGSYVELVFRHLVSKITITGVQRTKTDNSKVYLGDVKITFPDMPRNAIFSTGISDDGSIIASPTVTAETDGEKGLSFNATSRMFPDDESRKQHYPFYLPPFDFEEYGEFIIEAYEWHEDGNTPGKGYMEECGPYYGHLKDLPIKGLKAGEHISLSLQVKDGQVFGMSTMIQGWSTMPDRTSDHSPKHKGIYNEDDLRRLFDYIKGHNNNFESVEELISIEIRDGKEVRVVRLFNDINLDDYATGIMDLVLPADFILDGLGHNITSGNDGKFLVPNQSNVIDLYLDGEKYS